MKELEKAIELLSVNTRYYDIRYINIIKQALEDVATLREQNATLSSNLLNVVKDSNKLMSANLKLQSKLDKIEELIAYIPNDIHDINTISVDEIKQILGEK
mgnify:CR=1 FL=1